MKREMKLSFLFYTLTLFLCLNFLGASEAQVDTFQDIDIPSLAFLELTAGSGFNYTFESVEVAGVDFLELTASNDFEGYAGNTLSPDGTKRIGFTLIDGAFMTYDFPGSQNTYFYALGNDGRAAGHYQDSEGLHHGVILADGELRQYDFPDAVETFIYGISDTTGALTGSFIDALGVRRGFSGDEIIEFPGAMATYADFVNAFGFVVGSYIDSEGLYHIYIRTPTGELTSINFPDAENIEFLFTHSVNRTSVIYVTRVKRVDDVVRTYVGGAHGLYEFRFPGSVSTEGWNINADDSVVGFYDLPDGSRHGFVATPAPDTAEQVSQERAGPPVRSTYTFESIDVLGVDYLGLAASSDFEDYAGYTPSGEKMVGFTLIDGEFMTYDFPGSQNTYFYALGNDGTAAGHYQDSDGLHHGVILENGELRQYDFPDAVETEIYGISDATGALTGNFTDASGIRRGFTGDTVVEHPGALETYTDFVNARGSIVGSFVDADGKYEAYVRIPDGKFLSLHFRRTADLNPTETGELEYIFVHGISDVGVMVARAKATGGIPRTYFGSTEGLHELQFPGSVSTEGYNINQDGSIVGHYMSTDGRIRGFIAKLEPVAAELPDLPTVVPDYSFETVDVEGVDFLELTASSDFEDYAGNTRRADGKTIAFTLIDGVFSTYDFPGSQNTYFYALGNNGQAAGYYEDSDGLHHGVILADGELQQYDFPDAVETEIFGISDTTGALTGNFIDASGVRRGFSGNEIIEFPGALETYTDFVSAGRLVGSYVDASGIYHAYIRSPQGDFISIELPDGPNLAYYFVHGINDAGTYVARAKVVDDIPRTYVGTLSGREELRFPGSVSTQGYNINQDGSIVGNYDTSDGRRHGFIARPAGETAAQSVVAISFNYTFESIAVPGVTYLELTASSDFEDYAGNTRSPDGEKIVAFTLIDGVFTTYDFPNSQNTYFYALGNNGIAAGHYEDNDGLHHGVILESGELKQYDFPGAVETEIYGISDTTGALTGNFIDASGIRRGFSGETIIEFPGATATYADFIVTDRLVGSYIDADGVYHPYIRDADGRMRSIDVPGAENMEYIFTHGINDAGGFRQSYQSRG